jgi:hypothetical protein
MPQRPIAAITRDGSLGGLDDFGWLGHRLRLLPFSMPVVQSRLPDLGAQDGVFSVGPPRTCQSKHDTLNVMIFPNAKIFDPF